ncbi:MAG: hypothetical protein IPL92_10200 [Saprospiraceae bacterium]|nr:hypothetical protein [Candidatus Opimibacter iunctus]
MKEWHYNFDPVSKQEWIRQIEADLRQKPLESLQSEWWPGEPLVPLVAGEDSNAQFVCLPTALFTRAPLIAEYITTGNAEPAMVNHRILQALKQGVQYIILQTPASSSQFDEAWLTGVHKEMIEVAIQPSMDSHEPISTGVADVYGALTRIARNDSSIPLSAILNPSGVEYTKVDTLRFIYHFPSSGVWDKATAKTFSSFMEDLKEWISHGYDPESFFRKSIITVEADQSYFKHIIQTRVLHLIWNNLKQHFISDAESDFNHYLECHIAPQEQERADHFLIRASMSALAASLCGTQVICIHPSAILDNAEFYERIHRNIHYLLQLESDMYKGVDPLAGAYAIDWYTSSWAQHIWDTIPLEK